MVGTTGVAGERSDLEKASGRIRKRRGANVCVRCERRWIERCDHQPERAPIRPGLVRADEGKWENLVSTAHYYEQGAVRKPLRRQILRTARARPDRYGRGRVERHRYG